MSGVSSSPPQVSDESDVDIRGLRAPTVDKPPTLTGSTGELVAQASESPNQVRSTTFSLQKSLSEVKHPIFPATEWVCETIERLSHFAASTERHSQKLFLLISRARDIIEYINSSIRNSLDREMDLKSSELLGPFFHNMRLLETIERILRDVEAIPETSFGQFDESDLRSWTHLRRTLTGHLKDLFSVDLPLDLTTPHRRLADAALFDDRSWIGTLERHIRLTFASSGSLTSLLKRDSVTEGEPQASAAVDAYTKFARAGAMLTACAEDDQLLESAVTLGSEIYLLLGDQSLDATKKWIKLNWDLDGLLVCLDMNGMTIGAEVRGDRAPDTATTEDSSGHTLSQALSSLRAESSLSQHGSVERVTDPSERLTGLGHISDSRLHLDHESAPHALAQSAATDQAMSLVYNSSPSARILDDFDSRCPDLRLKISSSITASDESQEDNCEGDVRESDGAPSTSVEPTHPDLPLAMLHVTGESERPPRLSPRGGRSTTSHPSGSVRFIPAELWIIILKFLATDRKALACLSRTCRTMYEIIISFLWTDVVVSLFRAPQARAIQCFEAINGNPSISRHVKRIWADKLEGEVVGSFVAALKECSNLQSLELFRILFNPQLCEILHELPSLRSLEIQHPDFTTVACTTKLKPMSITKFKFQGTPAVQGWGFDFVCNLTAAPGLQVLELDLMTSIPVIQMYTISSIPPNLSSLHLSILESEERAPISAFLGVPNNPLRRISVGEHGEDSSECGTGWVPLVKGPETLPRLRSVTGHVNFISHLAEGVDGLEIIMIDEVLKQANEFEEFLRRVKERHGDTLKTLVFATEGVIETWFGMVSDAFPGLTNLAIGLKEGLTADDVPTAAIEPFRRLQRIIVGSGNTLEPSGRMSIPEGPLSWETVCPELRQIVVTNGWGWKRLEKGCWVKEELEDGWFEEVFNY